MSRCRSRQRRCCARHGPIVVGSTDISVARSLERPVRCGSMCGDANECVASVSCLAAVPSSRNWFSVRLTQIARNACNIHISVHIGAAAINHDGWQVGNQRYRARERKTVALLAELRIAHTRARGRVMYIMCLGRIWRRTHRNANINGRKSWRLRAKQIWWMRLAVCGRGYQARCQIHQPRPHNLICSRVAPENRAFLFNVIIVQRCVEAK